MAAPYKPFAPEYLTGDEAAAVLGEQRSRFQRAVREGAIPGEHPNGSLRRYFRRSLIEYIVGAKPDFADPQSVADVVARYAALAAVGHPSVGVAAYVESLQAKK